MRSIKFSVTNSTAIIVVLLALPGVIFGAESEYSFGHEALELFSGEAFSVTPTWVKVWLAFLMSTFVAGGYFAWKHPLARWVVGGFIVSMTTGRLIFSVLGLPFLGGGIAIMHIVCWSPALILLLLKRPYFDSKESTGFRIWSGVMTGVIIFSFIFDFRDAAIYIRHIYSLG